MGTWSLNGELSIVMFDYRRVWVFLVDVPEKTHTWEPPQQKLEHVEEQTLRHQWLLIQVEISSTPNMSSIHKTCLYCFSDIPWLALMWVSHWKNLHGWWDVHPFMGSVTTAGDLVWASASRGHYPKSSMIIQVHLDTYWQSTSISTKQTHPEYV